MQPQFTFESLADSVHLLPGEATARRDRNLQYLLRLKTENLLLAHYLEAGLRAFNYHLEGVHGGWDSVTSELRGMFLGHWLSAAAHTIAETGDSLLKVRADHIVAELARCQQENGGEWFFPIPEKYLHWIRRGKRVWAPQYVCHKNMLGLLDMYTLTGNQQALEILKAAARWFVRFTHDISRAEMEEMMDFAETGGMMEHWANLYAVTDDPDHLELMRRYERRHLFDPLERGEDVLTNMHANTTIPEVRGAARAYEVTGEERYRRIVENFWELAIRRRGTYATGGQTCGEIWTPTGQQSARLGEMNQEHCTIYNLMRVCEYLLRWTGEAEYADFYERNLYNGIFAQGHWQGRNLDILIEPPVPPRGLISYFLPLAAGSRKKWGSELDHFWCCYGTLVQANAIHHRAIFYRSADGIAICQFLPARAQFRVGQVNGSIQQTEDRQAGDNIRILPIAMQQEARPTRKRLLVQVQMEQRVEFTLKIRRPWWLTGAPVITVNGQTAEWNEDGHGFLCLQRAWQEDELALELPFGLHFWPLPDRPDTVALMNGPVVLAGLVGEERTLYGDVEHPEALFTADDEREWQTWKHAWRTVGQPVGWRFKPLYEIGNEVYTVYFPVRKP